MKIARLISPAVAFVFATLSGTLGASLLPKTAWINKGTIVNPVVQQVSVSNNCVIGGTIPCTVVIVGTAYQIYWTSAAAAAFDPSQRLLHR